MIYGDFNPSRSYDLLHQKVSKKFTQQKTGIRGIK